jgi:hypothetical protein
VGRNNQFNRPRTNLNFEESTNGYGRTQKG